MVLKLHKQYYLVYIIVLKLLELKTFVLNSVFKVILTFFGTFSHKIVQTWFVCHKTWHFHIYYCVEMVRVENISHMLEITC